MGDFCEGRYEEQLQIGDEGWTCRWGPGSRCDKDVTVTGTVEGRSWSRRKMFRVTSTVAEGVIPSLILRPFTLGVRMKRTVRRLRGSDGDSTLL